MDIEDASKLLRLKKATIYKLTANMEIPRFKRGKRLYFKRSELVDWISKSKQKTMKDIEMEADNYISNSRKRY